MEKLPEIEKKNIAKEVVESYNCPHPKERERERKV